jgi:hypothetical protein
MTNTKVVRLEKLWNFVVDNFLIWNRLGPQTSKLHMNLYNMWGTEMVYEHMWGRGFESHPERIARDFYAKNCTTCDFDGGGRALGGGVLPLIKIFFLLFIFRFFREFFALWKNPFPRAVHKQPPVELAHFYWPPAQVVLENATRNKLPTACIVCPCTSVFLFW